MAWIRTGLAGVGGGIVIIRYLTFHNATHQMLAELAGLIFVLWSIAIFVLALAGYRRSHKNLKTKDRSTDSAFIGSTYIVTLLVLTLVVISIILLAITFKVE